MHKNIALGVGAGLLFIVLACERERSPEEAAVHYEVGYEFYQREMCREAIVEFDKVVDLDPDLIDVYDKRGECHVSLGEYAKAIDDFDEYIGRTDPDHNSYVDRAWAYIGLNQCNKAVEDFNRALNIYPKDEDSLLGRAVAYTCLELNVLAEQDINNLGQQYEQSFVDELIKTAKKGDGGAIVEKLIQDE
ncbi:MAG: tetratricopeptide repeat protein [Dehalococcoidia bacterium]